MRVVDITGHARIRYVGNYPSCMVIYNIHHPVAGMALEDVVGHFLDMAPEGAVEAVAHGGKALMSTYRQIRSAISNPCMTESYLHI